MSEENIQDIITKKQEELKDLKISYNQSNDDLNDSIFRVNTQFSTTLNYLKKTLTFSEDYHIIIITALQAKYKQLLEELEKKKLELQKYTDEQNYKKQYIDEQMKIADNHIKEIENLKKNNLDQQTEIENLKKSNLGQQTEIENLKKSNLGQQTEIENLKKYKLDQQTEIESLKKYKLDSSELNNLKNKNINLIQSNKQLQQDLNKLIKQTNGNIEHNTKIITTTNENYLLNLDADESTIQIDLDREDNLVF